MGIGVDLEQRLQEQAGTHTLLWIRAGKQSCALRAQPLNTDAGQLDPKVTFLESIKLGTPACWR